MDSDRSECYGKDSTGPLSRLLDGRDDKSRGLQGIAGPLDEECAIPLVKTSSLVVMDVKGIGGASRMTLVLGGWRLGWRYLTGNGCCLARQHPDEDVGYRVRSLPEINITNDHKDQTMEGSL